MSRNKILGSFKNDGWLYKVNETRNYYGTQLPVEGKSSSYEEVGAKIKWRYANGKGLSKEQLNIFQGWLTQSGSNKAIEVYSDFEFNIHDKIKFDIQEDISSASRIESYMEKRFESRQLSGNRKKSESVIKVLLIG